MPRVTTVLVSDYQRDRTHLSAFQRGESRTFTVEFRALIPDGQALAFVEWWCLRPDVTFMSNVACASTSSSITLGCLNSGRGVMKCQVTLTNGSKFEQLITIDVSPSPWFFSETPILPNQPTYVRADNTGVLMLSGDAPNSDYGQSYSYAYQATGGTGSYTFAITSGSLPPGITLSPSTGIISGITNMSGHSSWTIQVTDSAGRIRKLDDSMDVGARVSYQQTVINDGAYYLWPLDDADDTAVEVIRGLNGTYAGSTLVKKSSSLLPNGQGFSAKFGSPDAQVNIPIDLTIQNLQSPFSIEWWGKVDSLLANGALFLAFGQNSSLGVWAAYANPSWIGLFRGTTDSGRLLTGDGAYSPGIVHHFVLVAEGQSMAKINLYKNGQIYLTANNAFNSTENINSEPAVIGGNPGGVTTPAPVRTLQYVAVYLKALTATQVAAHYASGQ